MEADLQEVSLSSLSRSKTMKHPPKGWIKVNFDASYEDNGLAMAMAMVVKDEVGRLLLLLTHFLSRNSPHEAEVKALGSCSKVCLEKCSLECWCM